MVFFFTLGFYIIKFLKFRILLVMAKGYISTLLFSCHCPIDCHLVDMLLLLNFSVLVAVCYHGRIIFIMGEKLLLHCQ